MANRLNKCRICQKPISRKNAKTCSPACRSELSRRRYDTRMQRERAVLKQRQTHSTIASPKVPCRICGDPVPEDRVKNRAVFCKATCRREAKRREYLKWNPSLSFPRVPTGTTGAIGELLVALDLLRKGYAVFRALSPAAPCDLAVLVNGQLIRVEVTTAHRTASGTLIAPKKDNKKFDVLALAISDGSVRYSPESFWSTFEQTTKGL